MSAVADEAVLSGPGANATVRRAVRPALITLSYLVLACLAYWPTWPLSSHGIVDCACGDPVQQVWFLRWTSFAAEHAHNPFFTYYLHAPHGANLAFNTSFPLLGLLGLPITSVAGPVAAYNLLLRLALALSALSMYWVLRRYTSWWPAAYLGGLLFGFTPYMVGHAHRHLFLAFLPLVPLVVPVVDAWLVRPRRDAWISGGYLGLLIAGEFLISPEITALTLFVTVLVLALLGIRYRHDVRSRLVAAGQGLVSAIVVLIVIGGLPAYYLFFGSQRPVGTGLENVEPAAFWVYGQLALAVAVALALDRFRITRLSVVSRSAILAVVSAAILVPDAHLIPLRHDTVRVPPFFTTGAVNTMPQGTLALTYPYSKAPQNAPMLWQIESGMRFRIFGGQAWVPRAGTGTGTSSPDPPAPQDIAHLMLGQGLRRLQGDPGMPLRVRTYLRSHHVGAVLIDQATPGASVVTEIVTDALNVPPARFGGMTVWLDVQVLLRGVPGPGH